MEEKIILKTRQRDVRLDAITKLIQIRKNKKMTQQDLAEVTGIRRPNIARIEKGNYNPTLDMIVRMADGLNLDVELIFKERESKE
ncbi:MAG: helix-turn-helix transcriptional regulator [Eubacteriales bacterium]